MPFFIKRCPRRTELVYLVEADDLTGAENAPAEEYLGYEDTDTDELTQYAGPFTTMEEVWASDASNTQGK